MTLADVVHRIATDEDFAAQLRVEPQATLKASGLDLSAETLATLLKVLSWVADPLSVVPLPNGDDWVVIQLSPQWTLSSPSTSK